MKIEIRKNKKKLCEVLDSNQNKNSKKKIKNISSFREINILLNNYNIYYKENLAYLYEKNKIYSGDLDNIENNITNIVIDKKVEHLKDLLHIIDLYPLKNNINYNINLHVLNKIKSDLKKLNEMIGLEELKKNIVQQILYYLQNLYSFEIDQRDFMHTVLSGPPGTGKTEVAKIIGNIFAKMYILKENKFKKVTRSDFVAGYLGQTAIKTKKLIEDSLDGVLFIDEAYSLGNPEKRDSFAKEALDTLCEALSNHKDRLMVIIAGYEDELEKCFFSYNEGLESRFIWKYKTDYYSGEELMKIFYKKIKEINWNLDIEEKKLINWFNTNKDKFKNAGRSIETLLTKSKILHSVRIFGLPNKFRKTLILEDLDSGLEAMNIPDNRENYICSLYS